MDELRRQLLAAREGDRSALADWVRITQPEIWQLCRLVAREAVTEEVVRRTYLCAHDRLAVFQPDADPRLWLLAIAGEVLTEAITPQAAAGESAVVMPGSVRREPAAAVLHDLDPETRLVFVLTQSLGLSYAQAAVVLARPVEAIQTVVAEARCALVARLGTTGIEGQR